MITQTRKTTTFEWYEVWNMAVIKQKRIQQRPSTALQRKQICG